MIQGVDERVNVKGCCEIFVGKAYCSEMTVMGGENIRKKWNREIKMEAGGNHIPWTFRTGWITSNFFPVN